jgi:hypothetical protein
MRADEQVERQIANPLAVEGLVTLQTQPALGVPRGWLQTMHGIDFKTLSHAAKQSRGTQI